MSPRARARIVSAGAALAVAALASDGSAADVQACLTASEKGQRARAAGKLREAREQFLVCGAEGCPALVRKDCTQWQGEVVALLPTVVFGAKDARGRDLFDVTITMDGEVLARRLDGKSVAVDPGPHTFRFEVAGSAPVIERALVKEGERARAITVTFVSSEGDSSAAAAPTTAATTRADGGRSHTAWPWIVVGVGGATLIGGLVVALTAPELPAGCDRDTEQCTPVAGETAESLDERRKQAGRSDGQPVFGAALAGAGAAVVVAGLVWHFLEPTGPSHAGVVRLTPWTSGSSSGLSLGGSF